MKKLFALLLVLGMASFASAGMITMTPNVGGATDIVAAAGDVISFDISASGADFLRSTGLLEISVTGDATLDVMGATASNVDFWSDGFLVGNNANLGPQDGTVGRTSLQTMSAFWLTLPNPAITGLKLSYNGGIVDVTVTPVNVGNQFGNTTFTHGGVAGTDLEAMGGTMTVTPEPMTMSLLGLGGLALIRRRRA